MASVENISVYKINNRNVANLFRKALQIKYKYLVFVRINIYELTLLLVRSPNYIN